jgi:hypothetical protein
MIYLLMPEQKSLVLSVDIQVGITGTMQALSDDTQVGITGTLICLLMLKQGSLDPSDDIQVGITGTLI